MHRNGLLLLVAVVLASGGYLLYAHYANVAHVVSSTHAQPSDPIVPNDNLGASALSDAMAQRASRRGASATITTDLHSRYESAIDLLPLAEELRVRAAHGDTEALVTLADLEAECMAYVVSNGDRSYVPRAMQKLHPEIKPWVDSLLARTTARCERFTKNDLGTHKQREDALMAAAKQGSALAKARLLSRMPTTKDLTDQQFATAVHEIIATGNPDAIFDLSAVLGAGVAGREKLFDVPSGSEVATDAYVLAACRMGRDCGPNSQLLAALCFNGVACGYQSYEELVRKELLPPAEIPVLNSMALQIVEKAGHH
jgi:hypothetical protein